MLQMKATAYLNAVLVFQCAAGMLCGLCVQPPWPVALKRRVLLPVQQTQLLGMHM
jgi:hypothetical protein